MPTTLTRQPEDEAALWEEGARGELAALLDLVRADPQAAGLEHVVMARLAVVGAAVMKSIGVRRAAAGAGDAAPEPDPGRARPGRRGTRTGEVRRRRRTRRST